MREANQKQMRIQFSGMNNEKVIGWVCSLQPSDPRVREKIISVCWWVAELSSPVLRVLKCSLCNTNTITQGSFFFLFKSQFRQN